MHLNNVHASISAQLPLRGVVVSRVVKGGVLSGTVVQEGCLWWVQQRQ